MSSVVIFESNGVVAEWNKQGPHTVTTSKGRKSYPTRAKAIAAAERAAKKFERVEMVDGRVYLSPDNWVSVFKKSGGRMRPVADKAEADLARYIAVAQSRASADD